MADECMLCVKKSADRQELKAEQDVQIPAACKV
jgi:hypothetical protein